MSDDEYVELMRAILLSDPIHGLPREPSRLLDHVYIGCQANAESLKVLQNLGITHVLNCAGFKGPRTTHGSPYEGLDIDYFEFQAEDTDRYDISRHFSEAFGYLDMVGRRGGKALVHCALGINRSGAICLGYLMHSARMTLLEATKKLKDKRRICVANKGFQRLLVRYARNRGYLDKIEKSGESPFRLTNSHYSGRGHRYHEEESIMGRPLEKFNSYATRDSTRDFKQDQTLESFRPNGYLSGLRMSRRDNFSATTTPQLSSHLGVNLSRDISQNYGSIDHLTNSLSSRERRTRPRSQSTSRLSATANGYSIYGFTSPENKYNSQTLGRVGSRKSYAFS